MACTPKRCGLIKTEFVFNFQALRTPGVAFGVFATEGPLAAGIPGGRQVFLADILDLAEKALKKAVSAEAPQQDLNQANRVFGIVPDPDIPPCENGCECAGVDYKALMTESVRVTATFSVRVNTYFATTFADRTVSEGVGRCRSAAYNTTLAFAEIPELNLELVLARAKPITQDEITALQEIFGSSAAT